MGYQYGIKQSRESLLILSSEDNIYERAGRALLEICVVEAEDVSLEHFNKIQELHTKNNDLADLAVTADGSIIEIDKKALAIKLIQELVWLCTDIIEFNAQQ